MFDLIIDITLKIFSAVILGLIVISILTFLKEKEKRAARIVMTMFVFLSSTFVFLFFVNFQYAVYIKFILLLVIIMILFIYGIPYKKNIDFIYNVPKVRYDERMVMFSRILLKKESSEYQQFYSDYPMLKENDDHLRSLPGLLSKYSVFYNKYIYSASDSLFSFAEFCRDAVDGEKISQPIEYNNHEIINLIHELGRINNIHSIGVTSLQDYHLYSKRGRGNEYGKTVKNNHKTAIAFTVEMDNTLISTAPRAASTLESANQYVHTATFAIIIAGLIRNLGYHARAHIDGDYELICPLVARDAGLGEIGRMGILITPRLGPRVRIAVVTTDMSLPVDIYKPDSSVINFCLSCKKCAENCPAQAISYREQTLVNNVKRWNIDMEKCFEFWCKTGTDCGRCISVCPYSHENNLMHNLSRHAIRNNNNFLKLAVKLDDLLYKRHPAPKKHSMDKIK